MSLPDYGGQGWQDIVVTLDGPVAVVKLNRTKHVRNNFPDRQNKGKGGKNRRRGKNENDDDKRELVFREDGQDEKRLAHIRGKMRKKVWINQGDIILLLLRGFQDGKADVIVKYTANEARNLKAYGELPENSKINETDTFGEDEGERTFEFGEDGEVDIDDI
ncbi:hypothetical protein EDB86DRAFT_3073558 [Lactarius hatsudake]|nr:hypothetical protein EDB86DRAFT_3073558 [Lactarius hatsudake]